MKLSKFQIIGLLLLIWLYTNSGGGLIRPPFVPNLQAEDLESKVVAAMLVLADDHPISVVINVQKPEPVLTPIEKEPVSDPKEAELFPGRYPRAIVLTNMATCAPCIDYDKNTINIFRKDNWKNLGWTVGNKTDNVIEIVDLSKDENKFYEYFDKLSSIRKDISPTTPTTIFLTADGLIKDVKIGGISHAELVKHLKKEETVTQLTIDNMSQSELISLHNSLHGGGNWKWPGNLKLHLAHTHGVK